MNPNIILSPHIVGEKLVRLRSADAVPDTDRKQIQRSYVDHVMTQHKLAFVS